MIRVYFNSRILNLPINLSYYCAALNSRTPESTQDDITTQLK